MVSRNHQNMYMLEQLASGWLVIAARWFGSSSLHAGLSSLGWMLLGTIFVVSF